MYDFQNGATSKGIDLNLVKASDGTPATALLFNTAGLKAYYHYVGLGAPVQTALATLTVGGAWASGGFVELDATNAAGLYRWDIPNALLNFGIGVNLYVMFSGAGVRPTPVLIKLKQFDPYATPVLTLDPVAVRAAVGLAIANLDTQLAGIGTKTTNLPPDPADASDIAAAFAAVTAAIPSATANANALFDQANGVETGLTFRQHLRLSASALFCKASGLAGFTPKYRDYNDTKNRLDATTDAFGNRTSVTRDAT